MSLCNEKKPVASLYLVILLCLTFCRPMDYSLPVSSVHGDSPGKNTGVVCHAVLQESNDTSIKKKKKKFLVPMFGPQYTTNQKFF